MTDDISTLATEELSPKAKKARGRILNSEWGYVLYQYTQNKLTYREIGEEFGCTPSAVFYAVKMAEEKGVTPVPERPLTKNNHAARELNRIGRNSQFTAQKVEEAAKPQQPSETELMAEKAKSMLEDEVAQRVFDRMSNLLLSWNSFKAEPNPDNKQLVKDSVKEALRAASAMELKVELTQTKPQQPQQQQTTQVSHTPTRVPEMA